jgi:uncharacterized protein (TIGR04552 family)
MLPMSKPQENLKEHFEIPWQDFEVVLGLKNASHIRSLNFDNVERCACFFENCGFTLNDPSHEKEFEQFWAEALYFIRHALLSAQEREIYKVPKEILYLNDQRKLLILASERSPRKRYVRTWACALLKVMYAIANLQYSGKLLDLETARETIFKKIKSILTPTSHNKIQIEHSQTSLILNRVEWKEAKTRTSIVMKLLHKPESIVDEVFDYLGVRFIVEKSSDIAILLKILIKADILIPHQVVAARTRNNLLNLKQAKKMLVFALDLLSAGTVDSAEFKKMYEKVPWIFSPYEDSPKRANMFTSQHYKAVQFTVRHLVRTQNPAYVLLESK